MTRLLCSKHQDEVGAIRNELLKAGIRTEIRSNPLAAALNVTRLELWVENESDYATASRLCTQLQAKGTEICETTTLEASENTYIDVDVLPAQSAPAESRAHENGRLPVLSEKSRRSRNQDPGQELEEARLLLEKEIEDFLEREKELSETCAALRGQVGELKRSLADSRDGAEKQNAELTALKSSREREVREHTQIQEQLRQEVDQLQLRLKSVENALAERQSKLERATQQLQSHQSAVVELRKEIVLHEQESEENKRTVSKIHAELALEREARLAAEQKAEKSAAAQDRLANQLAQQKEMQDQMRVSVETLKSLRGRLRAQKGSLQ